ncbi:MAG: Trk system potassium transporter TrkA [Bacteroidales bacterium]|nr:Trk system potassium transporter TrkA [Bacteroidales bacterium]
MKIIIEGAGEVGSHLAKMLRAESNDVTVIDNDEQRLSHLSSYADVETILGNPSSIKVLKSAGVEKADLYIAVYPFATQEVNIVGAMLARQLGAAKVIARINDEEYLTAENRLIFKEMGIELTFYPEKVAADEIVDALKHSSSTESMDFAHGKLQMAVFKLDENSPCTDATLGSFTNGISQEELLSFRIIAISRNGKTIIPKFDSKFLYGDLIYVISKREGLPQLSKYFGSDSIDIRKVMVLGGTAIGEMVARSLASANIDVKIIDDNKERCIELSETLPDRVMIVNGNGRDSDFLFEESISDYDAFVAVTPNDEANMLSCVVAKKLGVRRTIAEVENIEYIRLAEEMGVDTVINKKLITASRIFKFTLSGKARFVKYMNGTDAEVIEYTVAPGSAITKDTLKNIPFPKNAIIGGIIRGNDSFIAVGDTRIEPYDRVAIFALPESIKDIDKFFK